MSQQMSNQTLEVLRAKAKLGELILMFETMFGPNRSLELWTMLDFAHFPTKFDENAEVEDYRHLTRMVDVLCMELQGTNSTSTASSGRDLRRKTTAFWANGGVLNLRWDMIELKAGRADTPITGLIYSEHKDNVRKAVIGLKKIRYIILHEQYWNDNIREFSHTQTIAQLEWRMIQFYQAIEILERSLLVGFPRRTELLTIVQVKLAPAVWTVVFGPIVNGVHYDTLFANDKAGSRAGEIYSI
ncbi:hypothetical protein OIO90_003206 [Microbotryomycetes sp. JL221]|nr:hypothetical protein OIO90_003206 [Microbotryomycetes sp. JL221]